MRALNTAATGMQAQQLNVEVIANNIANMNTTGFKRQRAEFTDLLYQSQQKMGVSSSVVEAMSATRDVRWLDAAEALQMHLITEPIGNAQAAH